MEEKFEKGFPLKTHQIFSVHTTPKEFKNATITGQFGFVFQGTRSRKSDYYHIISLVFKMFLCPHENDKLAFSNSSGLKSVFKKLPFRDGLVWTVNLTVEIKLRFNFKFLLPALC